MCSGGGTVRPELAAVPERVITREPSAELRADQRDSDSLPAYEDLDRIIEAGPTGRSIQHVARDLGADLLIVGVHDRSWLGRLLGSTPKSLLTHEVCDMLAVRIGSDEASDARPAKTGNTGS